MNAATDAKREAIVEAAARLFMERGYEATSVRDLARVAGVSQGALYYYIRSKPDVLVVLHNSFIDDLLDRLAAVLEGPLSPAEKLRAFIRTEMEALERNRTRVAAFIRERRSLTPEAAATIQAKRDQVDRILDAILQDGIESGAFRPLALKSARMAILGMVHWAVEWFNPEGPIPAAQFAADFTDLILHGLMARPAEKPRATASSPRAPR